MVVWVVPCGGAGRGGGGGRRSGILTLIPSVAKDMSDRSRDLYLLEAGRVSEGNSEYVGAVSCAGVMV